MKVSTILQIASIIERENRALKRAIDSAWEATEAEETQARIEKQLELNKTILTGLKHEITLIEAYGEAFTRFDEDYYKKAVKENQQELNKLTQRNGSK